MKKSKGMPDVTDISQEELDAVLNELEQSTLSPKALELVKRCVELALWLPQAIQKKSVTLHRLKVLLFGKGYGNPKSNAPKNKNNSDTSSPGKPSNASNDEPDASSSPPDESNKALNNKGNENGKSDPLQKRTGHGRLPRTAYQHLSEKITLDLSLKLGESCPACHQGKLGNYPPGHLLRVKGQSMARIVEYTVEKLRCSRCQYIVMATIPPDVGSEKYDATFKAMIVLQKYYVAVPFYRQENFQQLLGFPLSDSTQWDLVQQVAAPAFWVFNVLLKLSANGTLVYNDDTSTKILEHITKIQKDSELRRGMFTTGMVVETDGHRIALFLNGVKHAGENLKDVLALREEKEPIIQMCDGLLRNTPADFKIIVCNCLSHGFRKFEEMLDFFPEPCLKIMKYISQFYKNDDTTKEKKLGPAARLAYHQVHSQSVADELFLYMGTLLEQRIVEPNSPLGSAILYMQKRREKLTRFLSVEGAPLDSNTVERALKISIRTRKNSMFFKTYYSAKVAGVLTSLIYTCELAGKNPLEYLTHLQKYEAQVAKDPSQWLPWNYEAQVERLGPD